MKPLSASFEDIERYKKIVEKNEIRPDNMPPCLRCYMESSFFKIHGYRERQFLIIVKMMVFKVFCSLVRFICHGCGKTFTYYPDFAIPYKQYTQQTVEKFSANYTENDEMTYEKAVMVDHDAPGYENGESTLSPSSIHRWIKTLGEYLNKSRNAIYLVLQTEPELFVNRILAQLTIPERIFRSEKRKSCLIACRQLIYIKAFFESVFSASSQ